MIQVSEIKTTAPATFLTPLQQTVYAAFEQLQIPFQRVDTTPAITMEDCRAVDQKLQVHTVKTLLLCNRQQTEFYLLVTLADKAFNTHAFSQALDIARVSFAPAVLLDPILGTTVGSTTVLSALRDTTHRFRVIIDRAITDLPYYGCSDGTTTCYLKIETRYILDTFLTAALHRPQFIDL